MNSNFENYSIARIAAKAVTANSAVFYSAVFHCAVFHSAVFAGLVATSVFLAPELSHSQPSPAQASTARTSPTTYSLPPAIAIDVTDSGGSFRADIGSLTGPIASVSGPRVTGPQATETYCQNTSANNYFTIGTPPIHCVIEECVDPSRQAKLFCVSDDSPPQLVLGPITLTK